jgi:Uma2 family endonuclease
MAEAGVLSPDDRTELIEGEVVDMAPIGSVHAEVVTLLTQRLIGTVGGLAAVRTQSPVRLSVHSEPQPDVALVKAKAGGYRRAHPSPGDVLLLIEVSDTTLRYDLGEKAQLYATHGILEYWVVDLVANRVWRHRHPRGTQYAEQTEIVDGALELPNGLGAIATAKLF